MTGQRNTQTQKGDTKSETTAEEQWITKIAHALRNLDDRSVLNRSPLARLAYVEKLAKERYGGHILPRGLALREVLVSCVDRIINDLHDEPPLARVCQYLAMLKQGLNCQQISGELGLSREHISRVYRRRALELVTTEFLSAVKSG